MHHNRTLWRKFQKIPFNWNCPAFVYFYSETRVSNLALFCQFFVYIGVFLKSLANSSLFISDTFVYFFKWLAGKETWIFKLFPWIRHSVHYLKNPFWVGKCWEATPPKMAYQKDSFPTNNFIWLFKKRFSTIYIVPKNTTDAETAKLREFICKYEKNNKSLYG